MIKLGKRRLPGAERNKYELLDSAHARHPRVSNSITYLLTVLLVAIDLPGLDDLQISTARCSHSSAISREEPGPCRITQQQ